jgi:hypothetical protein
VINIRWAHNNPNPRRERLAAVSKDEEQKRAAAALAATNPALQAYAMARRCLCPAGSPPPV